MPFSLGQPMLIPKDSGVPFGTYSDEELKKISRDLTETERNNPHSKYYDQMPAPLAEEHIAAIKGAPMDSGKAFEFEDYGKMMNRKGYCEVENGYCVLGSGVTYAAAMLRQKDLTDEVVEFYNQNFAFGDSLFYKIWNPECHYLHYTDGCLENFGFGRMNMRFTASVEPEDLGLNMDEIRKNDPDCIYIGGTSAAGYNLDGDDPGELERNTILFYYRKTDYGREARIRLFYGIGIEDGNICFTIPKKVEALNIAHKTMQHIMQEYTNDRYLETAFWKDMHPVRSTTIRTGG